MTKKGHKYAWILVDEAEYGIGESEDNVVGMWAQEPTHKLIEEAVQDYVTIYRPRKDEVHLILYRTEIMGEYGIEETFTVVDRRV